MIYHVTRFTLKPDAPKEEVEVAMEALRRQGREIPSVRSFVVGPDFGGEYEYGAAYVIEDLDGYAQYMVHPTHLHSDHIGLPLVDKFASFDVTDDPDPEIGAKIAEIHRRRYETMPDITKLVSDLGEYTGSAAPGTHGN